MPTRTETRRPTTGPAKISPLGDRVLRIARELMSRPTAPFREEPVRAYIRDFCEKRGLRIRQDEMGNVVATSGRRGRGPVLAFAAHMDHPGFIIRRSVRKGRTSALFYGGVEPGYFPGTAIRVFSQDRSVRGRVVAARHDPKKRFTRVQLDVEGPVRRGDAAMWDLAACRLRGGRLYSRACDDLVGCIGVLALLDEQRRRRIQRRVTAVFTVAEESGLHGATFLGLRRVLPKAVRLVAIEASRELPVARIADGVVIRVGDSRSVFTPGMTAFMTAVAEREKRRDSGFRYQRKLMDGGRCESSVYQALGYTSGAVCVPLGNYHNRDFRRGRIREEYVSVDDLVNMVKLFLGMVRMADTLPGYLRPAPPTFREELRPLGERFFFETS
jgi:endoglucanase